MTEKKISPWPWKYQPEYVSQPTGQEAEYMEPSIWDAEVEQHIAVIRIGLKETVGNGLLITAAPELLDALRKAHETACDRGCPSVWPTDEPRKQHKEECWDRAALLKRYEDIKL